MSSLRPTDAAAETSSGSDIRAPVPPRAPVKIHGYTLHGVTIEDPYAWLVQEDDPEARAYLAAEIAYTKAITAGFQTLQDVIYEELRGRIAEDDCSVPERIEDYFYLSCSKAGKEYEVHKRYAVASESQAVVLDENLLAEGKDYFDLGEFAVCPRHRLVAYTIDTIGDEYYRLYVRDIETGQIVEGPIENVSEDVCWCEDATGLFYVRMDDQSRPYAACLHILGTPVTDDHMLFHEFDPAFFVSLWKSRSRSVVFIESHSNTTSEIHFVDANATDKPARCFRRRQAGIEYALDHRPGEFLVLTNWKGPNFRLLSTPETNLHESAWRELIAHQNTVSLEFMDVYAQHTVLCERRAGVPVLSILDVNTNNRRTLEFDEPAYELELEDLYDFNAPEIWITHSAPTVPDTVYAYPLTGGDRRVLKKQELDKFEPHDYSTSRVWVPVTHDVEVPLTLYKKKSTKGPAPVLLQGYGAYEERSEVYFDSDILSLLDRGVIVAVAHVRGGGELGRPWYEAGKLLRKENSFNDFIACGEYLINQGYTNRGQIALHGSSAGGLLVAVAMQRRPELFAGVVAEVPFVDVINTLLDDDAPLTRHDIEEFGDPKDPAVFQYMLGYSPYDNVRAGAYPPLLVTAALEDQRVGYWEPLKWVAKLRAIKTDNNPLLLKVEDAGHAGQSGRYQELKHTALVYGFLLQCWGITVDEAQ